MTCHGAGANRYYPEPRDSIRQVAGPGMACHGAGGPSVGPATPTIAGREKETFVEVLTAYKTDEHPSIIMGRIAKGYTEASEY